MVGEEFSTRGSQIPAVYWEEGTGRKGNPSLWSKGDLGLFPTNFSPLDKAGGSELEQFIKSGLTLGNKFEHFIPTFSSNNNKLDLQTFI